MTWNLSSKRYEILDSDGRCVCRIPAAADGGLADADRLLVATTILTAATVRDLVSKLLEQGSWHDDGTWVYEPGGPNGPEDTGAIGELARMLKL